MRMGVYGPFPTLEKTHLGLDHQCKVLVGREALRQGLDRRLKIGCLGTYCVGQAGLCLASAGVKGVHYHTWLCYRAMQLQSLLIISVAGSTVSPNRPKSSDAHILKGVCHHACLAFIAY